ncbi:MAG: zeta toxin family protein [Bryobacteraceae bacterium]
MPNVIIIAGPNGAGKTTAAPFLLQRAWGVTEFVNADFIAQGISVFNPGAAAMDAGRVMLKRLHQLAEERANFAFETTLASRSFAPWIVKLKAAGYEFHLHYLWIPSTDLAVARVAERVSLGGHDVPDDVVRRRYEGGLQNFFRIYMPLATGWRFYDNRRAGTPRLVAHGSGSETTETPGRDIWELVQRYR